MRNYFPDELNWLLSKYISVISSDIPVIIFNKTVSYDFRYKTSIYMLQLGLVKFIFIFFLNLYCCCVPKMMNDDDEERSGVSFGTRFGAGRTAVRFFQLLFAHHLGISAKQKERRNAN